MAKSSFLDFTLLDYATLLTGCICVLSHVISVVITTYNTVYAARGYCQLTCSTASLVTWAALHALSIVTKPTWH